MKTGNILETETAGVNQILPHKHKWAWDLYEQAIRNNWVPTEKTKKRSEIDNNFSENCKKHFK